MTDRPSATEVFAALSQKALPQARPLVRCEVCDQRIGMVVVTEHGSLWIGLLHNRERKQSRSDWIGGNGQNIVPMWVEQWRPYYIGECKCRRNSVPGPAVFDAAQRGARLVRVPAQE